MKFCLKTFFSLFVVFVSIISCNTFSYQTDTWYTEFNFSGGLKNYTIDASGGDTNSLSFYLNNLSNTTISGKFSVVDAVEISGGVLACKSEGQNNILGKYASLQPTGFSIPSRSILTGNLSFYFPDYYSGIYNMCLIYTPFVEELDGYVNSEPRKALFITAILKATAATYHLKVFPGSRSKSSLANKGEIRFYDSSNNLVYSTGVETNQSGYADFLALIPGNVYTVIYKGQSHLASYLYNFSVVPGETELFDFTTGFDLTGVQNYTNVSDNGLKYQIAGDLKNVEGKYDFTINGNDIAIITISGFVAHVDDLDPRDLNGDNVINVSDLAIIGANFEQEDVFFNGHTYNGLR